MLHLDGNIITVEVEVFLGRNIEKITISEFHQQEGLTALSGALNLDGLDDLILELWDGFHGDDSLLDGIGISIGQFIIVVNKKQKAPLNSRASVILRGVSGFSYP